MTATDLYTDKTNPLTSSLELGVLFLGVIAAVSAASTLTLLSFIGYRCSRWASSYSKDIKRNVFVVLLANLFLADFFQSFAFLFGFHWFGIGAIVSGTTPCTIQGFFINFGDISSAFFVITIAIQTWAHIKFQQRLRFDAFVAVIVCIWIFALVLTVLGPVTTQDYFVDTGAWCWVDAKYNSQRLAYHYFWVFLVEFGTVIVYGFVIWELHRSSRKLHVQNRLAFSQTDETNRQIRKSCLIMCCYPVLYITLTLPLAVSRMIEISGGETSAVYRIFCGCFLVSSGWVDTLMYVVTRASFLRSQGHQSHDVERPTSIRPAASPQPVPLPSVLRRSSSPGFSAAEGHEPARLASISSWTTNWSDTKTLPHHRAEEPFSTIDGELHAQTMKTLTLDTKS